MQKKTSEAILPLFKKIVQPSFLLPSDLPDDFFQYYLDQKDKNFKYF